MRKISLAVTAIILTIALYPFLNNDLAHSNSSAAPAGHTGSPGDNRNCSTSGCHTGSAAVTQEGLITSNIPASGYVPGETYSISATASGVGISRFGFQISPQFLNGQLAGSLIATNATETQLNGSNKYITHRFAGTSGAGSKSWNFNWIAPTSGSGNLTFYGAFNVSNNNGGSSGDLIVLSTLAVTEDLSASIKNTELSEKLKVYPNPAVDELFIESRTKLSKDAQITIMDLAGKIHFTQNVMANKDRYQVRFNPMMKMAQGVYLLTFRSEEIQLVKQIIVRYP